MSPSRSGTQAVYRGTFRLLHWSVAVLILGQLTTGFVMTQAGPPPSILAAVSDSLRLYDVHKSVGLLILLLLIIRLGYRIVVGVPPIDAALPAWKRAAAGLVHTLLYIVPITTALLGWIGVSLYPALTVFGSISLPAIAAPDREASEGAFMAHAISAVVLLTLAVIHMAAALHHHLVLRDDTLRRMLPRRRH